MHDRDHDNLSTSLIHFINDNIRILDEFTRPFDETWTSHVREVGYCQSPDFFLNPRDELARRDRTIF
jgi:hypothetical protein